MLSSVSEFLNLFTIVKPFWSFDSSARSGKCSLVEDKRGLSDFDRLRLSLAKSGAARMREVSLLLRFIEVLGTSSVDTVIWEGPSVAERWFALVGSGERDLEGRLSRRIGEGDAR